MPKKVTTRLNAEQTQIAYGTVLGDSGISLNGKSARLQMHHSITQKHYIYWKFIKLDSICTRKSLKWRKDKKTYSNKCGLRLQTGVSPTLTDIYYEIYTPEINNTQQLQDPTFKPEKKKNPTRNYLDKLGPLGLAVWWCDDGSITGGYKQGLLSTHSFSKEQVECIELYFREKWNIEVRGQEINAPSDKEIARRGDPVRSKTEQRINTPSDRYYYAINIYGQNLINFLKIIVSHIPVKQMIYKTFLGSDIIGEETYESWKVYLASHYVPKFFNSGQEFDNYYEAFFSTRKTSRNTKQKSN